MPSLTAYTNVENTALVLIQAKGFQIWYHQEQQLYYAEKDGWDFAAGGAVELLGVISIFEHLKPAYYKEYWWKLDKSDLMRNMPARPSPYVSVLDNKGKGGV